MRKEHMCVGVIWDGKYRSTCRKNTKVERDGKWYCLTHDPERVKARRAEQDRKWTEKRDAQNAARKEREAAEAEQKRRADLFDELVETLEIAAERIERMGIMAVECRKLIAKAKGGA